MKRLSLFAALFLVAGCAHHRDVRPGPNGLNRVLVKSEGGEEGTRDAIAQANHYCEQFKKQAIFMEEKQSYTGSMKESDYKQGKTIAKVAKTVGGAAWIFGGRNESNAGGIIGLGGTAADQAYGKGYDVDMKFKCQ